MSVSPFGVRATWSRHDLTTVRHRLKTLRAKMAQERIILRERQLAALEKAKAEKEVHGEFETEYPGYCGAQDTLYVGTLKGVGSSSAGQSVCKHGKNDGADAEALCETMGRPTMRFVPVKTAEQQAILMMAPYRSPHCLDLSLRKPSWPAFMCERDNRPDI